MVMSSRRSLVVMVTASVLVVLVIYSIHRDNDVMAQLAERTASLNYASHSDPPDANRQRLGRVRQVCRPLATSEPRVLGQTFLEHALVIDQLKTIYCYVPKVGTSSWKALFVKLSGGLQGATIPFQQYHKKHILASLNLTTLSSLPPDELQYKLDTYFKFMVVRHPLDRLASAFCDKFFCKHNYGVPLRRQVSALIIKTYRKYPPRVPDIDDVRFDEFVRFILSKNKKAQNEHWSTYQSLCQPCDVDYDYISTTETSHDDVPRMLKMMGAEQHIEEFQNLHREAKPNNDFYRSFYRNISVRALRHIVRRYSTDMDMFGYSWNDYLFGGEMF